MQKQINLEVAININTGLLHGNLCYDTNSKSLIIFAHGSGSSRLSPRNQLVAQILNKHGLATLLIDLLTEKEEIEDSVTRAYRFNISLLAQRLVAVAQWAQKESHVKNLKMGFFGASTGAAAALIAAVQIPEISAVVSRGGRPDLAFEYLEKVSCPTLLLVGGYDFEVIELNKKALDKLTCIKELEIIPRATHLFEEPGALRKVAESASNWFLRFLS